MPDQHDAWNPDEHDAECEIVNGAVGFDGVACMCDHRRAQSDAKRRHCYPQCRDPWFNECADCWKSGGR